MIFETPSTIPAGNALIRLVNCEPPKDQEGGDKRSALRASSSCGHRHKVSYEAANIVLVEIEVARGIAHVDFAGGAEHDLAQEL